MRNIVLAPNPETVAQKKKKKKKKLFLLFKVLTSLVQTSIAWKFESNWDRNNSDLQLYVHFCTCSSSKRSDLELDQD
jgi:hypothetical protein